VLTPFIEQAKRGSNVSLGGASSSSVDNTPPTHLFVLKVHLTQDGKDAHGIAPAGKLMLQDSDDSDTICRKLAFAAEGTIIKCSAKRLTYM
jgi:hypothetical protein